MSTTTTIDVGGQDVNHDDRNRRRRLRGGTAQLVAASPFLGLKAVLFGIFIAYPFFNTIFLSLQAGNFFRGFDWVGFQNYRLILDDQLFWRSLGTTFRLTFVIVPLTLVLSCAVGLLLSSKIRGMAFYRSMIYMPALLSIIATGIVWRIMIAPGKGPLDRLAILVTGDRVGWVTEEGPAFLLIVVVTVWASLGFYSLIFMAGFNGIPEEFVEAARVDGANPRQILVYVKLPLIAKVAQVVVILLIINSIQIFDLVFVLTKGGPGTATYTAMWYVYQQAFGSGGQIPYAATMCVVVLIITLILSILFAFVSRQRRFQ